MDDYDCKVKAFPDIKEKSYGFVRWREVVITCRNLNKSNQLSASLCNSKCYDVKTGSVMENVKSRPVYNYRTVQDGFIEDKKRKFEIPIACTCVPIKNKCKNNSSRRKHKRS